MMIVKVALDPNILISQGLEGLLIFAGVVVGCWMIAQAIRGND